jgi:hypothetical protein
MSDCQVRKIEPLERADGIQELLAERFKGKDNG